MRKSNLLLIAALAVLLVSLASYNVALKAEYRKGTYKDPFQNFRPINLKDFRAIDINAANKVNVKIMPGKYQVWVPERSSEHVKVKQVGNRLQIDVTYPEREDNVDNVIITCPGFSELKTNAFFWVKGRKEVKKEAPWTPPVTVEGFTLDSLVLLQDNASKIRLVRNKIGFLQSIAGISPGSAPGLEIESGNVIGEAHLTARNQANLVLHAPRISRLRHDFSDSTQVSFSGAAMSLLKKE